jgi:DNA repair exonuclease SbcCD nuclease subunit
MFSAGRLLRSMILVPIAASSFRCSCIVPDHHRRRRPCVGSSPPPSFRRGCAPSRGGVPRSSSSAAAPPPHRRFRVGEEVTVADGDDDGATARDVPAVVERKAGGWYTVRSARDPDRVMKRRASQLRGGGGVPPPGGGGGGGGGGDVRRGSHRPGVRCDDGPSSTAASADVVDLDSILRSVRRERRPARVARDDGRRDDGAGADGRSISPETLRQVASCHSRCNRWLIFSDLHVAPSTLPTCLEVLDVVHETAVRSDAGIIFLGDFWHHRGFVRVDCLNAVLRAMGAWRVPSIMIPGNHDQIDRGGSEHALTPLRNAYRIDPPGGGGGADDGEGVAPPGGRRHPGPLVLSDPTKFLNALFVPHTRDGGAMRSILSSDEAASSSALFVHADVRGASMNDLIASRRGLPASIFPAGKRVFSGHFHKPHSVRIGGGESSARRATSIRYVGSPYQTSFSESGQVKSLLLVDSDRDWRCIEEIPIDVGPRYHRASSVRHFLDYDRADVRGGDKVAVTIDQRELGEMRILAEEENAATGGKSPFDVRLDDFRKSGISVEIRDLPPPQRRVEETSQAGMSPETSRAGTSSSEGGGRVELEDLSPETTLAAYLHSEVNRSELRATTAKRLLECGRDLIREAKDVHSDKGEYSLSLNSPTELDIESVSVLGFGSFRQEVVYPLRNRGVLLLRGTNKDDIGSDR